MNTSFLCECHKTISFSSCVVLDTPKSSHRHNSSVTIVIIHHNSLFVNILGLPQQLLDKYAYIFQGVSLIAGDINFGIFYKFEAGNLPINDFGEHT